MDDNRLWNGKERFEEKNKEKPWHIKCSGLFLISIWNAIDTDDNGDKHESTSNDHNRKYGHGGLLYRYRFQKKETHSRKSVQKFVEGTLLPWILSIIIAGKEANGKKCSFWQPKFIRKALPQDVAVSSPHMITMRLFIRFSYRRASWPRHFIGYPFGTLRK